jgi:hypothetical protein
MLRARSMRFSGLAASKSGLDQRSSGAQHGEQSARGEPQCTPTMPRAPRRRSPPTGARLGRSPQLIDSSKVQPGRRGPDAAFRHFTPAGEQCIAVKSKLDCQADLIRPGQCL